MLDGWIAHFVCDELQPTQQHEFVTFVEAGAMSRHPTTLAADATTEEAKSGAKAEVIRSLPDITATKVALLPELSHRRIAPADATSTMRAAIGATAECAKHSKLAEARATIRQQKPQPTQLEPPLESPKTKQQGT